MNEREEKEYWVNLVDKLNEIHAELQTKPDKYKIGYSLSFGGILNAYREGDLNFEKAIKELKKAMFYEEQKMIKQLKDCPPEFQKIVDENFWKLIDDEND